MAVVVLVGCWVVAGYIIYKVLHRYRNPQSCHILILTAVFICWLLPFSLTFLLPIDVSSTTYEYCATINDDISACHKSWLYVGPSVRHGSWLFVYWATFILTWLLVPFLQGYVIAGEFKMTGKSLYSLRINILFYCLLLLLTLAIIIYLKFLTTVNTWSGITALLMALSNALGLLAVIIFLGFGLVRIPRHLWHASDPKGKLCQLELKAMKYRENLTAAEEEVTTITKEIITLPIRMRHKPELQEYVHVLLSETPLLDGDVNINVNTSGNGHKANGSTSERNETQTPTPILDLHYLEHLNYSIREAVSRRDRAAWQWRSLLEKSWHYQDVINNEKYSFDHLWTSNISDSNLSNFTRLYTWWWHVKIKPTILKFTSIFCILLSLIVFWSEVTLFFTDDRLSLVSRLIAWAPTELVTGLLLFYLALCTLTTFLKLRVLSYFSLVPGHHTDEKSLLFFAAYITRLTFPLGYNYLMLIEGASIERTMVTEFSKVMGSMDLVPLLGRYFNLYIPLSLTVICVLVALKLDRRIISLFTSTSNNSTYGDAHEHLLLQVNDEQMDGRELVNQARRLQERHIHGSRTRGGYDFPWLKSRNPFNTGNPRSRTPSPRP